MNFIKRAFLSVRVRNGKSLIGLREKGCEFCGTPESLISSEGIE
ncbi:MULTISPECIES: hypothetical protein [Bacillales]|nr:hypothetical protein [Brevibacillus sp. JNUCC-41]